MSIWLVAQINLPNPIKIAILRFYILILLGEYIPFLGGAKCFFINSKHFVFFPIEMWSF
jgi:hypothetical protein